MDYALGLCRLREATGVEECLTKSEVLAPSSDLNPEVYIESRTSRPNVVDVMEDEVPSSGANNEELDSE